MSDYWDWCNEVQYSESDSAGFYYPPMDYHEGYADYERNGVCSDVSMQMDLEFKRGEDPVMEVEEVLHKDPPAVSEPASADYRIDEPLDTKIPPKAPPRARCSEASKLSRVAFTERCPKQCETGFIRENNFIPDRCSPIPIPPVCLPYTSVCP
ncbi:hypothetical protein P4O66_000688 [Electrophorus voltai]|uniref:Uncharacterized protein n=1 Tax=Electrophorus voltai TaxID=2609070 RepID=A0AAD9DY04_9TELE|nr:hypothetical protein P4O66_000688 [Electrophorus voltai]